MEPGRAAGRVTLTVQQAQARAQVSRRTLYNWLKAGKIDYVRTAGGAVRIFEDSLFRAPPEGGWPADGTKSRFL
jgi:excisionase family DNA binding protein